MPFCFPSATDQTTDMPKLLLVAFWKTAGASSLWICSHSPLVREGTHVLIFRQIGVHSVLSRSKGCCGSSRSLRKRGFMVFLAPLGPSPPSLGCGLFLHLMDGSNSASASPRQDDGSAARDPVHTHGTSLTPTKTSNYQHAHRFPVSAQEN